MTRVKPAGHDGVRIHRPPRDMRAPRTGALCILSFNSTGAVREITCSCATNCIGSAAMSGARVLPAARASSSSPKFGSDPSGGNAGLITSSRQILQHIPQARRLPAPPGLHRRHHQFFAEKTPAKRRQIREKRRRLAARRCPAHWRPRHFPRAPLRPIPARPGKTAAYSSSGSQ